MSGRVSGRSIARGIARGIARVAPPPLLVPRAPSLETPRFSMGPAGTGPDGTGRAALPPDAADPAAGDARLGPGGTGARDPASVVAGGHDPRDEAPDAVLAAGAAPGPGGSAVPHPRVSGPEPSGSALPGSGRMTMRPVLYAEFFGLTERPFMLQPDPSFIYWSNQHKRAFSVLEFGILSSAPITLVTGEIGAGKTTLLRALLDRVDPNVVVGLVSNAQGGRGELLQWVLNALGVGIGPGDTYVQLFQRLQEFIVGEYAAGRRVILIFDEAQNLSMEGLEELRLLTNINSGKDDLLQLILVGQPELREMVLHPNMRQLTQRITASFHLTPMDEGATASYIAHRLRHAGGTGQEFAPAASAEVHRVTRGIPRLVNQLCDFAMLYAWSAESRTVTGAIVAEVLKDQVFFGANAVAGPVPGPASRPASGDVSARGALPEEKTA